MAKVSVVIASYNHEKYVVEAVRSVLAQTGVDFELLIADDGSVDETAAAIRSIRDERIKFEAFEENRGAVVVLNELVARATGEYVAVMNSDDIWLRADKLKIQVEILSSDLRLSATFGRARFIDGGGRDIRKEEISFGTVFDQDNRSQGAWLRKFYEEGNCLCHPSVLIRRSVLKELGPYDFKLRQLPDFDMWVRMVKKYPIHVSCQEFVGFRVLPGENASAPTVDNQTRTINEHFFIIDRFFHDFDLSLFRDAFQGRLQFGDVSNELDAKIEVALLLINEQSPLLGPIYRVAGIRALEKLLDEPVVRAVLKSKYKLDGNWFHRATGTVDTLHPTLLKDQLRASNQSAELLARELSELRNDRERAEQRAALLQDEVKRLVQNVERLAAGEHAQAAELTALRASSSWRITKPLRKFGTLIRQFVASPGS